MSRKRILFSAGVLLFAFVAGVWETSAQNLPPTPRTPDLMGIYPGMPASAARAQLQKRSSTVNVRSAWPADSGFGLNISDPTGREGTNVNLTLAPNDPMVWWITRSQAYQNPGPPLMLNTVLTALREKYGKETMTHDQGGGGLYVFWIFDQSGKLLATADPTLQGCNSGQFSLYMRNGLPPAPTQVEQTCFKSYFAVKASFNSASADGMLNSYTVELVNLPYAYRAAMNTANEKKAADQKAQQELKKRGEQNKPSF
ncbi:MAG TPA: hypothetical protein VFA76_14110 [Terriglobales bacterium]|nr:hypothetical protein [Terriglobales bacterium]